MNSFMDLVGKTIKTKKNKNFSKQMPKHTSFVITA